MPRVGAGAGCRRSMSEPAATPKVVAYATLAGVGLLAAVVFGNVAIVALAAPFGFALVIGLLAPVAPLPEVRLELDAVAARRGRSGDDSSRAPGDAPCTPLRRHAQRPCRAQHRSADRLVALPGRRFPGPDRGAGHRGALRAVRDRAGHDERPGVVRAARQSGRRWRSARARRAAEG